MPYALLADLVVVVHLGFVVFVALGGYLALRRPWVLWLHVPAVLWALGIVTVGWPCPLTGVEIDLRERAGQAGYDGGFVDEYLTGVLYPERYERLAQALLGVCVVVAYGLLLRRWLRRRRLAPAQPDARAARLPRAARRR